MMPETSAPDDRKDHRFAASGLARVSTLLEPELGMEVQVVNVSANGALIHVQGGCATIQAGSEVIVQIGALRATGTVRHYSAVADGVNLGIHFSDVQF